VLQIKQTKELTLPLETLGSAKIERIAGLISTLRALMFLATSGGAGTQYHPMAPSRLRPRLLVASAGRPSAAPPSYMHIACSQQFQYFIKHATDGTWFELFGRRGFPNETRGEGLRNWIYRGRENCRLQTPSYNREMAVANQRVLRVPPVCNFTDGLFLSLSHQLFCYVVIVTVGWLDTIVHALIVSSHPVNYLIQSFTKLETSNIGEEGMY
jgi:hypothetical protein